jgi:hypothetical protein
MTMIIINYAVKILTILVGVVLVSGVMFQGSPDKFMFQIMGGIFILWGVYRIIVYANNLKRYKRMENDEEED